jgi:hypothetical protein
VRTFGFDLLECPRCDGKMRLLATIDQPEVVHKILEHLGVPTEICQPRPARSPPEEAALCLDA